MDESMRNFVDWTGRRVGKLTVIHRVEDFRKPGLRKNGYRHARITQWLCLCDCGNERTVRSDMLRKESVASCGCYRRQKKPTYRRKEGLPPGRAARNFVYKQYRLSARTRGLAWELTDEEFDDLTGRNCRYCGCPPSRVKDHGSYNGTFTYNGIDRKDNSLGYVIGNVVPCCTICNRAKRDMPYEDFIAWITQLVTETPFVQRKALSAPRKRKVPASVPTLEPLF
jgi:hypothetical protein